MFSQGGDWEAGAYYCFAILLSLLAGMKGIVFRFLRLLHWDTGWGTWLPLQVFSKGTGADINHYDYGYVF
jgi:hypothetical protein